MLLHRTLATLAMLGLAVSTALAGCAPSAPEDLDQGDGSSSDELVTERQLGGSELPNKTLSLTFDDGPGPRTKELAEFLGKEGVPATFFINGKNVPGRQMTLDAIVEQGHFLANHTQHHLKLTALAATDVVREVSETHAFIERLQPDLPFLIRAPYGAWNGRTAKAINATPMQAYIGSVYWDIGGELTATSAADWDCWGKHVSVERCGELYLTEIRSQRRGIVLMHDVHGRTVDMMKQILPVLKAEGYAFVPLLDVPAVKRAIATETSMP